MTRPLSQRGARALGLAVSLGVLLLPHAAFAYVGPGAGIAVVTTALAFIASLVLAVLGLLLWPIRMLHRALTRRARSTPRIKRAVVIGLDGLDPDVSERLMREGKLPNLSSIANQGVYRRLATTFPAMSPVAWSTFATGVNPAKHGIFDFLTRDPNTYAPNLSSVEIRPPRRRIRIGRHQLPLGRPLLRLLRKSTPFWKLLGQYGVECSILRVPMTFPAQPFDGTLLSAMCVPDLEGSQGTFSYFTANGDTADAVGGRRVAVGVEGDVVRGVLEGPPHPFRSDGQKLSVPFVVRLDRTRGLAHLLVSGRRVELRPDHFSEWVRLEFGLYKPLGRFGPKVRGICRFRLLELSPGFRLYVTPVNIDPEHPVLPISHPRLFSAFFAKLIGRYATLGLAEDTWALNERVLSEEAFLEQAWQNHAEREAQFFAMLDRVKQGVVACVFDGSDRIQHMFMRFCDDGHPARAADGGDQEKFAGVIDQTYQRLDEMVGRVLDDVDIRVESNLVVVLSDHGFKTFRRGLNLNSWLLKNGYLVLEPRRSCSGEWFAGVDWGKTRAFALGLGGIYLNVRGRESKGLVDAAEARSLAEELAARLRGLEDPELGRVAIRDVYPAHTIYDGPYAEDAPDLIVGYAAGWRASWEGVRGIVNDVVFCDNEAAWSGDHCIDPELVPGVFFASQPLCGRPESGASIADVAPTLLELFGVPIPEYMDGESLVAV